MTIQTTDVSTRVETVKAIMEASTEDLDFYFDAIKRRRKAIGAERARAIKVGDTVVTDNLSPRYLNDLQGTVTSIVGARATIALTESSVARLMGTRHAWQAKQGTLGGLPLTTLVVQS